MSKEELRKEAQESYIKLLRQNNCRRDYNCETYNDGYIAGAEPREKQLEETNLQNAICEEGLKKRIAELEKENAELKEAVKYLNPCGEWNDDVHDCEFRHYAMEYGSQLTKAKELLLELYDCIPSSMADSCKETLQKVALFFKDSEVEK